jgi:hypothetical protein
MNWSARGNVLNQYLRNTSIGTTVTARKFPPKVMLRKNARACDVTKIITIGRIKNESLENGTEKCSQVNLCAEPSIN